MENVQSSHEERNGKTADRDPGGRQKLQYPLLESSELKKQKQTEGIQFPLSAFIIKLNRKKGPFK